MQGTAANSMASNAQFQNLYTPLANISTLEVNVRIAAQIDATAMIDIDWGNWNFDFGYNFWARTCEKIKPACQCSIPFDGNVNFALKGDAHTYGFVASMQLHHPFRLIHQLHFQLPKALQIFTRALIRQLALHSIQYYKIKIRE